jgi:hypothetical protein
MNFMAAIGPDFKAGRVDALPVSNADVGATAARLLNLTPKPSRQSDRAGNDGSGCFPVAPSPRAFARHRQIAAVSQWPAHRAGISSAWGTQRYFDAADFRPDPRARGRWRQKQKRRGKPAAAYAATRLGFTRRSAKSSMLR